MCWATCEAGTRLGGLVDERQMECGAVARAIWPVTRDVDAKHLTLWGRLRPPSLLHMRFVDKSSLRNTFAAFKVASADGRERRKRGRRDKKDENESVLKKCLNKSNDT